jgi:hypothetical protein
LVDGNNFLRLFLTIFGDVVFGLFKDQNGQEEENSEDAPD